MCFAANIKAADAIHEQAVRDGLQIILYSVIGDFASCTGHGICNFFCRAGVADVIEQKADHTFQHGWVLNFFPFYNVVENDGIVKTVQVCVNIPPTLQVYGKRERAIVDVIPIQVLPICCTGKGTDIFGKGKGEHL